MSSNETLTRRIRFQAKCSKCGLTDTVDTYPLLNIQEYPKLRRKVRDTSVFIHECSHCHAVYPLPYSMNYIDPGRGLIVCMALTEQEYRDARSLKQENGFYGRMLRAVNADAEVRIVRTPMELAEKIMIHDRHYDDRIIEILKFFLKQHLEKEGENAEMLFYFEKNHKEEIVLLRSDGSQGSITFQKAWYQKAYAAYHSAVSGIDDIEINPAWAKHLLRPVNIEEEGTGVSVE